jgi:hypothetical protein
MVLVSVGSSESGVATERARGFPAHSGSVKTGSSSSKTVVQKILYRVVLDREIEEPSEIAATQLRRQVMILQELNPCNLNRSRIV